MTHALATICFDLGFAIWGMNGHSHGWTHLYQPSINNFIRVVHSRVSYLDEALRSSSSDNAHMQLPWKFTWHVWTFFCKMPPMIVFLLFVGLIRIDTYYICSYVAAGMHDTASIMHENVLSREVHFSWSISPPFPFCVPASVSALCASTFSASCRCLSSFSLTNDFIKHITVALAKRLDAGRWAKMGGDSFNRCI